MNLLHKLKGLVSVDKKPDVKVNLLEETIKKPNQAKQMEEKTEIKTYEIDRPCPNCGEGKMRPFGSMEYGNQHPHRCSLCNHSELILGKVYPYLITERVAKSDTTQ